MSTEEQREKRKLLFRIEGAAVQTERPEILQEARTATNALTKAIRASVSK